MPSPLRVFSGIYLVIGLLAFAGCATGPMHPPSSLPPLVEALRIGGNVIYMRHTTADVGRDVQGAGEWWKKCGEGHRMLSDKGRTDAAQIGESIWRLRIPISEIRCSEYCRAAEAARLLSLGDPMIDARLNGWPAWKAVDPERGLQRLAQGTRALLAAPPAQGNVLLLSHKQDFPHPTDPVLADLPVRPLVVVHPGAQADSRRAPDDGRGRPSSAPRRPLRRRPPGRAG